MGGRWLYINYGGRARGGCAVLLAEAASRVGMSATSARRVGPHVHTPAVPRRVGPQGPHARRVCGGRGGAERRRLDN